MDEKFGRPEFAAQAQSIADRGVTLLRDTAHLLPLDATRPLRVLLVSLSADADPYPGETIEPEIRWRVDSLEVIARGHAIRERQHAEIACPLTAMMLPMAALFVRVADRKGNVGLPDEQRAFVNQMIAAGKPVGDCVFGSPYLIEGFPGAKTWLAEFSTNSVSQVAAVRALFGQVATARTDSRDGAGNGEARGWNARGGKSDDFAACVAGDGRSAASGFGAARWLCDGWSFSWRCAGSWVSRSAGGASVWIADA